MTHAFDSSVPNRTIRGLLMIHLGPCLTPAVLLSFSLLLQLQSKQVRFRTRGRSSLIAVLLVESIATLVQCIDEILTFFLLVVVLLQARWSP